MTATCFGDLYRARNTAKPRVDGTRGANRRMMPGGQTQEGSTVYAKWSDAQKAKAPARAARLAELQEARDRALRKALGPRKPVPTPKPVMTRPDLPRIERSAVAGGVHRKPSAPAGPRRDRREYFQRYHADRKAAAAAQAAQDRANASARHVSGPAIIPARERPDLNRRKRLARRMKRREGQKDYIHAMFDREQPKGCVRVQAPRA